MSKLKNYMNVNFQKDRFCKDVESAKKLFTEYIIRTVIIMISEIPPNTSQDKTTNMLIAILIL